MNLTISDMHCLEEALEMAIADEDNPMKLEMFTITQDKVRSLIEEMEDAQGREAKCLTLQDLEG